jgi:hypothetical protein
VDRAAAEDWIRQHVEPVGELELAYEQPWATVLRVPTAAGDAWLKACGPVQRFEPRLTASLFERWPDRVVGVLAHDVDRAWLLLEDGGTPVAPLGHAPELWQTVLPLYAELQRGEVAHAGEHLVAGVPDLMTETLPDRYERMLERDDIPLEPHEIALLQRFAPRFAELCAELGSHSVPDTVQHDDLHQANVWANGDRLLVLDWGDACISHPFASLFVPFCFLDDENQLPPRDPWYERLRDAYLEPWGGGPGSGLVETFDLAIRVGTIAHAFAWFRQFDALPDEAKPEFMRWFPHLLRLAVAQADE